jgi:hypothetical protein
MYLLLLVRQTDRSVQTSDCALGERDHEELLIDGCGDMSGSDLAGFA